MNLVDALAALAAGDERLDESVGDVLGRGELGLVGVARPLLGRGTATEREVLHGLATDEVVHDLLALVLESGAQLVRLTNGLRGECARKSAVRAEDDDGGPRRVLALGREHVVHVRVGRDRRHGARHRPGVRRRGGHARLSLLNPRGGDELHRARDLLGRLGSTNLLPVDPKLRSHVCRLSLGVVVWSVAIEPRL